MWEATDITLVLEMTVLVGQLFTDHFQCTKKHMEVMQKEIITIVEDISGMQIVVLNSKE